tara:strand:- start:91 stop:447 length:357 start_codon:yes stop_codon:yes gene_type:complete
MLVSVLYNANDLEAMFKECGRENSFTRVGMQALFEHLEELSEEMGEDIKIDVIALCCEFAEYDDIDDYNGQNGTEYASWDEAEENENDVHVVQFDRQVFVRGSDFAKRVGKIGGIVHG